MSHAKQLHNRRYLNDYLEIINREGLPGNVKSDLCLQVQNTVIATVQHVIEEALAEELYAYLGLARYEHLPWGRPPESTRSGSYQLTGCEFQVPQNLRRLINVYASTFMP